ncbi:MAG: hypothetical protein V4665_03200 [Patescibacteria group bacterium]
MKIFVSHSQNFDFTADLYEPLNDPVFAEHSFFFPHKDDKNINTQEEIKNSDLVLAEVSFPSTGQGIELGWGMAIKLNEIWKTIAKWKHRVSQ